MADFTPRIQQAYFRNGPEHRSGADVSFLDIVKLFGFQSVKVGRWVSASEQQLAANLFFDALCDLMQLLQVPPDVISLKQSLSLQFGIGGQPGSCAFYQPQGRILALAKNAGGGSLAHEWFHAFDHYIARHLFQHSVAELAFSSTLWLGDSPIRPHPLNQALNAGFKALFLSPDGQSPSGYVQRCARFDRQHGIYYYAKPEELAARAFEHLLQRQPQKNSFLVSGTIKSETAKAGLYPDSTLTEQLSHYWLGYFRLLGQSLENTR
ncbi:CLCA_X family protein [Rheinheimera sp.]|uniref:CLCA_X family protein n=1 Tax=Rheinheimera sp. TaxID=1869214 RepID=UPI00307D1418